MNRKQRLLLASVVVIGLGSVALYSLSKPQYAAVDRIKGTLAILIHDNAPKRDVLRIAAHLKNVRKGLVYKVVIHRMDTIYIPDEQETARRLAQWKR